MSPYSRLQIMSDLIAAYHNVGCPRPYNPRLCPVNIGYVSLGQDYRGVVYIDSADQEAPEMVYVFDAEPEATTAYLLRINNLFSGEEHEPASTVGQSVGRQQAACG